MAEEEEKKVGIIDGGDGLADVESGHGDDDRGGKSRNAALGELGEKSRLKGASVQFQYI